MKLRRILVILLPLTLLAAALVAQRAALATALHSRLAGEHGGVAILVTDHREAIGDFQSLRVTLSRIELHRQGAPPLLDWLALRPSIPSFELTELKDGSVVAVAQPQLPAGTYDGIRLGVARLEAVTGEGSPTKVGIRLRPMGFETEVVPGDVTPILVDLTVIDLTDHGSGYQLVTAGLYAGDQDVEARLNPPGRRSPSVPAPDFTLSDQHGRRLSLSDFRGKVVVFTPIFTHCTQTCPLYTAKYKELEAMLEQRGLEDQVQLLMITVDPERDTVEVVEDYTELRDVSWPILTGEVEEVLQVLESFRIQREFVRLESTEGLEDWDQRGHELYDVIHVAALVLIDPAGRMSWGFSGVEWQPEQVLAAVEEILAEAQAPAAPGEAVPTQAAPHVPEGSEIDYASRPPSSGPHYERWLRTGVYAQDLPPGYWVHNLEHGYIVLAYRCPQDCPDLVEELRRFLESLPDTRWGYAKLVAVPYPEMDRPLVALAWGWRLELDGFDQAPLHAFYQAHVDQGPEDAP